MMVIVAFLCGCFLISQLLVGPINCSEHFKSTSTEEYPRNDYYYRGTGIPMVLPKYAYYCNPKCLKKLAGHKSYYGHKAGHRRSHHRHGNKKFRKEGYWKSICCFKKSTGDVPTTTTIIPQETTISPTFASFDSSENNQFTTIIPEVVEQTNKPDFDNPKIAQETTINPIWAQETSKPKHVSLGKIQQLKSENASGEVEDSTESVYQNNDLNKTTISSQQETNMEQNGTTDGTAGKLQKTAIIIKSSTRRPPSSLVKSGGGGGGGAIGFILSFNVDVPRNRLGDAPF